MTAGTVARVPYIALDVAAVDVSVGEIRRAVAAFAAEHGASRDELERIRIATSEAVTNVVMHAGGHGGLVHLAADIEDGELEVVVSDDGDGFRRGPSGGSGLGLGIIERSADTFLVRDRLPRGVEVWMRFALSAAGGR
jgi:anti-sigma regulatory factor (Ser/Thr protein kinase)